MTALVPPLLCLGELRLVNEFLKLQLGLHDLFLHLELLYLCRFLLLQLQFLKHLLSQALNIFLGSLLVSWNQLDIWFYR